MLSFVRHKRPLDMWTVKVQICVCLVITLRKHAYSNILKILQPKKENFQIKNSDIFHNSAQNIDCGYLLEWPRQGSSNEYPIYVFFKQNKKNNVYPCKISFTK